MPGTFLCSGLYFAIAVEHCEEAHSIKMGRRWAYSKPALVSVVFAVAAAEAALAEIERAIADEVPLPEPEVLVSARRLVAKLQAEKRSSTWNLPAKLLFAELMKVLMKGDLPADAKKIKSDLELLFDLRNDLIHPKYDTIESPRLGVIAVTMPIVASKLPSPVIWPYDSDTSGSWLETAVTPNTASWACETVNEALVALVEAVPKDSYLGDAVRALYLGPGGFGRTFPRVSGTTGEPQSAGDDIKTPSHSTAEDDDKQ